MSGLPCLNGGDDELTGLAPFLRLATITFFLVPCLEEETTPPVPPPLFRFNLLRLVMNSSLSTINFRLKTFSESTELQSYD
jgi:hypothetical protein